MAEGDLVRPDPMRVNPVYLRQPAEPEEPASPFSKLTPIGDVVKADNGEDYIKPFGGGEWAPYDPEVHTSLRDPVTGTIKAYDKPKTEPRPGVGILPSPDAPGLPGFIGRVVPGLSVPRIIGAAADTAVAAKQIMSGEIPLRDPLTGELNPEAIKRSADIAGFIAMPNVVEGAARGAIDPNVMSMGGVRPRKGAPPAEPFAEAGPNPAVARGPANPADFDRGGKEVVLPNGKAAALEPVDGDPFGPVGARSVGSAPRPAAIDGVPVEKAGLSPVAQQLAIAHAAGDAPIEAVAANAQAIVAKAASGDATAVAALPQALEHLSAVEEIKGRNIGPAEAAKAPPPGIVAYHGTPHDFDQFSINHIGSGEGAAAYGHGLYFAEHPEVAEQYQRTLSQTGRKWTVDGEVVGEYGANSQPVGSAAAKVRQAMGRDGVASADDVEKARQSFIDLHAKNKGMIPKADYDATLAAFPQLVGKTVGETGAGHLYQVAINADPEHFLDWDKPLSEQRPVVQKALEPLVSQIAAMPPKNGPVNRARAAIVAGTAPGQDIVNTVAHLGGPYDAASASKVLRDAGIPGIRYLDQGSRNPVIPPDIAAKYKPEMDRLAAIVEDYGNTQGKRGSANEQMVALGQKMQAEALERGSRNYVVFDDKHVTITHKNGRPQTAVDHNPFLGEAPIEVGGEPAVAALPPGPNAPGVGVADSVEHGLLPHFRVQAPVTPEELPAKPLLLTGTNNRNAAKQITSLDALMANHPEAATSIDNWTKMTARALASDDVPIPPYKFIEDINGEGATKALSTLSPGQIADADHGFANGREFRRAYEAGELTPATTGKLFLWSILSRGVSPYAQESLFVDAFKGAEQWIQKAAAGEFTPKDLAAYKGWAASVAPKGEGFPGAGSTHNLNAFGENFLIKMGQKGPDGVTGLQKIHDMLSDPNTTGPEIRREYMKIGESAGIDNKVVSFTLLVAGHDDVMVIDRVQARNLFDDGRFSDINIYDGEKVTGANGKAQTVTGSGIAKQFDGVRGLMVYEAIERRLAERVPEIYAQLGRPEDASIGRYHWETWVAASQQEASHGTLGAILDDAKGNDHAIARVSAKQGEYGAFEYGARYFRTTDGESGFGYTTPDGGDHVFSLPAFRQFLAEIKKPSTGVIKPTKQLQLDKQGNPVLNPDGTPKEITSFKVSDERANQNGPWYDRPDVDQAKLAERAAYWSDAGPGGQAVRQRLEDEVASRARGRGVSAGGAAEFTSPNVEIGSLSIDEAEQGLSSKRQGLLHSASKMVNKELGLQGKTRDVIGAWSDGSENSTVTEYPKASRDHLRLAAAMKGALANQKAVLVFEADPAGPHALATFTAFGKLPDIHDALLSVGLEFHTLVPTENGATVYAAVKDDAAREAVERGAAIYERSEPHSTPGHVDFIGTENWGAPDAEARADAQAVYARIIAESGVQGAADVWRRVRDRWGPAFDKVAPKPKPKAKPK